jgi:hypothetical protein
MAVLVDYRPHLGSVSSMATRTVARVVTGSLADGPTQYLLGALVLKLDASCSTLDLPHLGHFGGRVFRPSCSLIGTLTSKCLPHDLHSNS